MSCHPIPPQPLAERRDSNAAAHSLASSYRTPSTYPSSVSTSDAPHVPYIDLFGAYPNDGSLPFKIEPPRNPEEVAALIARLISLMPRPKDEPEPIAEDESSAEDLWPNAPPYSYEEQWTPDPTPVDQYTLTPLTSQAQTLMGDSTIPSERNPEYPNRLDVFTSLSTYNTWEFDKYGGTYPVSLTNPAPSIATSWKEHVYEHNPWSMSPVREDTPLWPDSPGASSSSYQESLSPEADDDAALAEPGFFVDASGPSTPVLSHSSSTPEAHLGADSILGLFTGNVTEPDARPNFDIPQELSPQPTRKASKKRALSTAFSDDEEFYPARARSRPFADTTCPLSDDDAQDEDFEADSDVDEEYVPEASSSASKTRAPRRNGRAANTSKPKGSKKKIKPQLEASSQVPATPPTLTTDENENEVQVLTPSEFLDQLHRMPTSLNDKACGICNKKDKVMGRHVLAKHTIPLGKLFIGAGKEWSSLISDKYAKLPEAEMRLFFACLVIPAAREEATLNDEVERFMELYSSWTPSTGSTALPHFDFADQQWAGLRELAEGHAAVIGWECSCHKKFNRGDAFKRHKKKNCTKQRGRGK